MIECRFPNSKICAPKIEVRISSIMRSMWPCLYSVLRMKKEKTKVRLCWHLPNNEPLTIGSVVYLRMMDKGLHTLRRTHSMQVNSRSSSCMRSQRWATLSNKERIFERTCDWDEIGTPLFQFIVYHDGMKMLPFLPPKWEMSQTRCGRASFVWNHSLHKPIDVMLSP